MGKQGAFETLSLSLSLSLSLAICVESGIFRSNSLSISLYKSAILYVSLSVCMSVYLNYLPSDFIHLFKYNLEHLWNHEKAFEAGVGRANEC